MRLVILLTLFTAVVALHSCGANRYVNKAGDRRIYWSEGMSTICVIDISDEYEGGETIKYHKPSMGKQWMWSASQKVQVGLEQENDQIIIFKYLENEAGRLVFIDSNGDGVAEKVHVHLTGYDVKDDIGDWPKDIYLDVQYSLPDGNVVSSLSEVIESVNR